jgi:hypothetical protein
MMSQNNGRQAMDGECLLIVTAEVDPAVETDWNLTRGDGRFCFLRAMCADRAACQISSRRVGR